MEITQLRGRSQLKDKSVTLGKLEDNFIKNQTWILSDDGSAVIEGIKVPDTPDDTTVTSVKYVKDYVESKIKENMTYHYIF